MGNVLTVSVFVIIALSALWGMIFKKNAAIRLFCVIARAVLAFIGTMILKSQLVSRAADLLDYLSGTLNLDPSVSDAIAQSPELTEIALALSGALIAVIVFLLLYFAIGILMLLVRLILMIIIRPKKPSMAKGAVFGAIQGVILVTCLLIPVSTYVGMVDTALPSVKELAPEIDVSVIEEPVKEFDKCTVIKLHRTLGGSAISNELTSMKLKLGDKTEKTDLNSELDVIMDIAVDISALTKVEISTYTEKETAIIEGIGDYITESKLIGAVLTNVIGNATDAWNSGNTYMGMAKPTFNPTFDPLIDKALTIFGADSHNAEYLGEDISTLGKLASKLIAANAAGGGNGTGTGEGGEGSEGGEGAANTVDLMETLMADGMVRDLLEIVNENPRMRPLIPAITNIGLSIAAQTLGIDADSAAAYMKLTESIAQELKNNAHLTPDERHESMVNTLNLTLDNLGITDIDQTETSIIAMSVIAYFDGEINKAPADVTADDIAIFLDEMTDAINTDGAGQEQTGAGGEYGQIKLNSSSQMINGAMAGQLIADICAIQSDPYLSISEKETRISTLLSSSPIFSANTSGLSGGKVSQIKLLIIASAERSADESGKALAGVSGLIPEGNTSFKYTAENILIDVDSLNGNIPKSEASAIINVISGLFESLETLTNIGSGDPEATFDALCNTLGAALDSLADTEKLYGEEKADHFIKTLLFAPMAKNFTTLNALDIENFIGARAEKDVSYTGLLNSFSKTVDTITSIKDGEIVSFDLVGELLDSLSYEGCGSVIAVILTPERLDQFGFLYTTPEKLESATLLIYTVFTNFKIESPEQRALEIEAFKHIITIAATANTSNDKEMFGTEGPFGCEAIDIVDTVLKSTSILKSLAEVDMTGNPFGLTLSEDDASEIADAISLRYADADAETKAALDSLAALFGVTL